MKETRNCQVWVSFTSALKSPRILDKPSFLPLTTRVQSNTEDRRVSPGWSRPPSFLSRSYFRGASHGTETLRVPCMLLTPTLAQALPSAWNPLPSLPSSVISSFSDLSRPGVGLSFFRELCCTQTRVPSPWVSRSLEPAPLLVQHMTLNLPIYRT